GTATMAQVKTKPAAKAPKFVQKLSDALIEAFEKLGFEIDVSSERLRGLPLHRIAVVSPSFERMWHSERQAIVWRIAQKALNDDEQLHISMILTMTPREAEGD